MEATELRIGNYLKYNSEIKQVSSIHNDNTIRFKDGSSSIGCFIIKNKNIKPIPLIEEILLKCPQLKHNPIVKIANVFNMDLGRNRELSISCAGTPNLAVFITSKEIGKTTDIVTIWNYDYDKELYLHTFQNLIFALTGEELTVNL